MNWIKKGLIYSPQNKVWWKNKYSILPTPEYIEKENIIRIYFGTTDVENNGRTTYIDVNAENPSQIIYEHNEILLDIGSPGIFDDSGVVPSSIVEYKEKKHLYYVGFQRCEKVPFMLFSGLAISEINSPLNFKKNSLAPIIDRSDKNPISNAAPYVLFHEGIFKMWFWLGKKWTYINNKAYIQAEICYAESANGIDWNYDTNPCILLDEKTEFSVGRPCVIIEDNIYKMWYSVRKVDVLYRLGYAESIDGKNWTRKDNEVGIDVSESGWDSEMICYPAVLKVKNKTYLFYNGNNNGETGFGYAELIKN